MQKLDLCFIYWLHLIITHELPTISFDVFKFGWSSKGKNRALQDRRDIQVHCFPADCSFQ